MSKKLKKSKKDKELKWTDDGRVGAAVDAAVKQFDEIETEASEEVTAISPVLFEDTVVDSLELGSESDLSETEFVEEVELEEEPEEEFSEDDLAAIGAQDDDEPVAIVFDEDEITSEQMNFTAEGTELEGYDSAAIEVVEELHEDRIASVVESLLFSTDRPQSVAMLKAAFKGTNVKSHHIRRALDQLQIEYAGARRGIYLEEVAGGYQLRTKVDNMDYMRRTVKARPFRVSGPALEVLAIVAYKQPIIKSQIDEIRGVESGHLLRALMEKSLVHFAGKSELPGKPMFYGTSRRFLETFGLRNLNELPSLNEIDQLIPEGIGDEPEKETLDSLTGQLSKEATATYSEGEEELEKIAGELEKVTTTTQFFEQEKARMKAERDAERARDIREAQTVGEMVSVSDQRWLERYERELATASWVAPAAASESVETVANEDSPASPEPQI
ncbi:MAG: SMC-Scp complex subunit ScpB [Bdellovibrionales bacterium]